MLAGCAGGAEPPPAARDNTSIGLPATLRPAGTAKGLIYSSSYGANTVDYYLKGTGPNNPIAGELKGDLAAPQGIAVDKPGNVYVTQLERSERLRVCEGLEIAADGTVTSLTVGATSASGDVLVYGAGASDPMETPTNAHFLHVEAWRSMRTATYSFRARPAWAAEPAT